MTIYKLNREHSAIALVIPYLERLWDDFNSYKTLLENTGISVSTVHALNKRDDWDGRLSQLSNFKSTNETWFDSTYASYSDAMDGAITSLTTIVSAIDNSIENSYWDSVADKPNITNISQVHRDALATLIGNQLEE
jgi:hypothetical protein